MNRASLNVQHPAPLLAKVLHPPMVGRGGRRYNIITGQLTGTLGTDASDGGKVIRYQTHHEHSVECQESQKNIHHQGPSASKNSNAIPTRRNTSV